MLPASRLDHGGAKGLAAPCRAMLDNGAHVTLVTMIAHA